MSSNEPPGGAAPQGSPEYGQPQDPWAGGFDYTPGQSSVPTDPIPHQYDPYQEYQPDPWSRATTQGQPWMAPPKPSRAVPVLVLVIVLIILGGGGGAVAWYLLTQRDGTPTTNPTASSGVTSTGGAPTSAPPATTTVPSSFNQDLVKVDDCLVNDGSNKSPLMRIVPCQPIPDRDVFRVTRVVRGDEIGQGGGEDLSDDEAREACAGSGFQRFYKNDFDDNARDIVICMIFQR